MNTMNGKKNLKGIPDLLQFRKKIMELSQTLR